MGVIDKEPSELGYEFGRWTTARLATYLEERTDIKSSKEQVRRILKQKKYAYLWAKYSLEDKQDPIKREVFKEKLLGYLEASKSCPERLQVWFWDESGFSLRVIRRKNWSKKGSSKKVTGQRSRGRVNIVNIMGGVRFHDSKRMCYFIEKGNGEISYEQLKKLNEFVKKEWVLAGNLEYNFSENGPLILIILDNASYHKKKAIIEAIEKEVTKHSTIFSASI